MYKESCNEQEHLLAMDVSKSLDVEGGEAPLPLQHDDQTSHACNSNAAGCLEDCKIQSQNPLEKASRSTAQGAVIDCSADRREDMLAHEQSPQHFENGRNTKELVKGANHANLTAQKGNRVLSKNAIAAAAVKNAASSRISTAKAEGWDSDSDLDLSQF